MQQFIQMATSALGTSEQVAKTVTGGLLDVVSKAAPQADVSALFSKLPGASDLLNSFLAAPPPPPTPPPDQGLLGSLTGAASSVLGAGASMLGGANPLGALSSLTSLFSQNGLDSGKIPQLLGLFTQFAGQHAGTDLVQKVMGAVPGASGLLSGALGSLGSLGFKK